MFKKLLMVALLAISTSAVAVGPSGSWRLDVTAGAEGIVDIAEIELIDADGNNVVDLVRNYSYEMLDTAGASTWTINHYLGTQIKTTSVDYKAFSVSNVQPGNKYNIAGVIDRVFEWTGLTYLQHKMVANSTSPNPNEVAYWYDNVNLMVKEYVGGSWVPSSAMEVTAVPEPIAVTGTVDIVDGGVITPGGNNVVTITFAEPVTGGAFIEGYSFDYASANRPGKGIPVNTVLASRQESNMFDNNKGSSFKTLRAPTIKNPLTIQYNFWVGDNTRFPEVVAYRITVRDPATAPRSWVLMYQDGTSWMSASQVGGAVFAKDRTTLEFKLQ